MMSLSVTQSVSVWGIRITSSEVILIQEEAGKKEVKDTKYSRFQWLKACTAISTTLALSYPFITTEFQTAEKQ